MSLLITADATEVSRSAFFDALFGKRDRAAEYAASVRKMADEIENGRTDFYGFPPLLVADARALLSKGTRANVGG